MLGGGIPNFPFTKSTTSTLKPQHRLDQEDKKIKNSIANTLSIIAVVSNFRSGVFNKTFKFLN